MIGNPIEAKVVECLPKKPPISPLTRMGNTIYLAGVIARLPDGSVHAPNDPMRQAELIFEKIQAVLETEGASLQDVVKLVTYFTVPLDRKVSEDYWNVRRKYFGQHAPASTGLQVEALIEEGFVVEVEAIASIGTGKKRADPSS